MRILATPPVRTLPVGFLHHKASLSPRNPTPEETETLAMPTHNCLRFRDDQGLTPILPGHRQAHPEQTISLSQSWSRTVPLEHCELLTQDQILKAISPRLPGRISRRISEQKSTNIVLASEEDED